MAADSQAKNLLNLIKEKPIVKISNELNLQAGMNFVLIYLTEHKNVYASTISKVMNISRARMAVILKKLESKNFVTKSFCKSDARKVEVSITKQGILEVDNLRRQAINKTKFVIDKIGYQKIFDCLRTLQDIKNLIKNSNFC